MNNDRIKRFSLIERISHWVHTFSFFTLVVTGLVVLSPHFHFLASLFGGVQETRIVHRIAGVVFSFGTLLLFIIGDSPAFTRWIKDITTWGKEDIAFLKEFPKEFLGGHANLPEQGRFNSGEKVNSLLILIDGGILTITGFMMWYADSIPLGIIRWAYPVHDIAAFLMMAVIVAHMYLGLLHPGSKEAINGMLSGTVSRSFAKLHHGKWYREMTQKEKKSDQ
ncbi:formate dehydrogenase subunit gamma [Pelosinus sp. sgz500959]|uniref:formate dehydrogenase subunit gamma n=1 Tax=Pelosinus sp. sgz500959 TaxID=3242472 RepID=UPI00366CF541